VGWSLVLQQLFQGKNAVKVIIEEGDVGELAPGVYDVKVFGSGVERDYWPVGAVGNAEEINISRKMCLSLDIDMDQKPVKRHWFNADQHEGMTLAEYATQDVGIIKKMSEEAAALGCTVGRGVVATFDLAKPAAMASQFPPVLPTEIDLAVGSKRIRLAVGDVIEVPGSSMHWTVTGFPSTRTWACTSSTGQDYVSDLDILANDLDSGKKVVRQRSIAPCNKSLTDCKKHGNLKHFGGYTNTATGKAVACPYTLGDSHCIGAHSLATGGSVVTIVVGTQLKWDLSSHVYTVSKIVQATPGLNSDLDKIHVPNSAGVATYTRGGLMRLIQDGTVRTVSVTMVDAPLAIEDQAFPGDALVSLDPNLHDCDECYGTGYYKAYGGPCSKGCIGGA